MVSPRLRRGDGSGSPAGGDPASNSSASSDRFKSPENPACLKLFATAGEGLTTSGFLLLQTNFHLLERIVYRVRHTLNFFDLILV